MALAILMPARAADDMGLKENQTVIGHTVTNDYNQEGAFFGTPGTYSIGAVLQASELAPYAGCKILGMRVASARNQASTRVFVYNTADLSKPLLDQKNRLYPGWTNVIFNGDPITIKGDESLFFGYDYVETPEISQNETGVIGITGDDEANAFCILSDGRLIDTSGAGKLCVQLIIDITDMPQANLAFSFAETGFKYKRLGEKVDLFASVANVGRDAVEKFSAEISFDGEPLRTVDVNLAIAPGKAQTWETLITLPANAGIGTHTLSAAIVNINGNPVDKRPTATYTAKFALYNESMPRNLAYVESFSSQQYATSSFFDGIIGKYRQNAGGSKIALVKVFEPGTPLALSESEPYWNTYAWDVPVFSVNRSLFVGEPNVAYCLNDYLVLPQDVLIGVVADIIEQDLSTPSFAGVEVKPVWDAATRSLKVNVSGEVLPELEAIYGKTALTVMLVEDKVKAPQAVSDAAGNVSVNQNYSHDDVLRAYLSDPAGSEITAAGGKYSEDFSTTLDTDKINPDNCRVVALLSKKGLPVASAIADYDIVNTGSAPLKGGSAVEDIDAADGSATYRWFTPDGIEVREGDLSKGLYIRTGSDGTTKKFMIR